MAWKGDRRRKRRRPPVPSIVYRLTEKWMDGEQNVQVPQELWHGMSVTDKLFVHVVLINHLEEEEKIPHTGDTKSLRIEH